MTERKEVVVEVVKGGVGVAEVPSPLTFKRTQGGDWWWGEAEGDEEIEIRGK